MNLMEKSNRDKNNNVTDSLANRTLIVTTILVRRKVKQRTAQGEGGEYIRDVYSAGRGTAEETMGVEGVREGCETGMICFISFFF